MKFGDSKSLNFFFEIPILKKTVIFVGVYMNKRFVLTFFSFLFLLPMFCFGRSLSIQIIQNNPGQDKIWDTSYFFEQCITDYFFENGQIVSSSPIWISSSEAKNESARKAALAENLEGGMDYLVRIEVDYVPAGETSNPQALLLGNIKKVQWRSYLVKTGIEVAGGSAEPGPVASKNSGETDLADFAGRVAYEINSGLENLK